MNVMAILRHGADMLLRNLGPALRVAWGPFLIGVAASAVLGALGLGGMGLGTGAAAGGALVLGSLVLAIVWFFVLSWVAVAWHRYILLEERPGLLPPLRADLVWPYLGRTILIGLILALLAVPATLVLGLVVGASQSAAAALVVGLGLWLLLGWVGTRLSLVLPATALGRAMLFGDSWSATAPASGAILLVVLVLGAINVGLGLLFAPLGATLLGAVLSLVVQWFTAMLGLSVLTTLYGALVERRPLAP